MPLFKVDAINIKVAPFSERDKLLTVFSKEKGKLSVIAKGARRPTSKFGGRCEILAYNHLLIAEGKNLNILSQAETIETFQKVRDQGEAFRVAAYVARLINAFLEEGAPHRGLFDLLLLVLRLLKEGIDPKFVACVFEVKFAHVEGFFPIIDRCSHCGRKRKKTPNNIKFSAAAGGIICDNCIDKVYGPYEVSFALLELAEKIKDMDITQLKKVVQKSASVLPLSDILAPYIGEHIGKDVMGWRVLA